MADNTRKKPEFLTESYASKAKDPANDPLAELARLIGQNDPFAAQGAPKPTVRAEDRPAPEWLSRPARAVDHDEPDYARAAYRAEHYEPSAHGEPAAHDHGAHDHGAHDHGAHEADAQHYPTDARYDHAAQPAYQSAHDVDETQYPLDDRYRVTPPTPGDYDPDSYYAEDGHMPPHSGEEHAPGRRRGAIMTIVAVVGLAVIGTAGAFGYRAYTSSSAPANPPVIKADTTPAKIVPPQAASPNATADAQTGQAGQGKPFQDRIGAPGAPERVVSREEQPVALPTPPRAAAGFPPAAPSSAAPAALVPPQPPAAATNEPKRVKTMTIRPDGDFASAAPQAAVPQAAAPQAPPAGSTRSAAPKQQGGASPMSIAPQSEPSARTKVASRPTQTASSGAYVVQVSAQRTEAEAQSSYRELQKKYPNVLAGRDANIRRVDLGEKGGIYYRAQVGAFTTSEQATAFCDNLKAAGGQCIVQRN